MLRQKCIFLAKSFKFDFATFLCLTFIFFLTSCNAKEVALAEVGAPTEIGVMATPLTTTESSPTASATQTQISPKFTPTPVPFVWLGAISLQYLASNEADATIIANSLGYLPYNAHPSNMCGPLAAVILRDGSVISADTNLNDFWLLNPRTESDILARLFPENRFERIEIRTSLAQYDFAENPLFVGDFLYLYAGPNGNFDHMLTVTRIDEKGRAYTLTNLNTDDGYIIDEFMLYDPNATGEGLFYRWNDRDYAHLGLTGSGGFDIWRLR
ncbi:MAG: hypothetical protein GY755_06625 [Chloroflexi bacterium]|nr:hypothetical protein [Chloroflexota bacterium]